MKIKTYCKEIDMNDFMQMQFDPEQCMITFIGVPCTEKLFFPSRKTAFEFYFEVIEGLYCEKKVIDLDHIQISYGHLNISALKETISERINNYIPDEK